MKKILGRRKRKKKSFLFLTFFGSICFCVFGCSFYRIFVWKVSVDANQKIKVKIQDVIFNDSVNGEKFSIDWEKVKSINNDTVAYLKVPNTKIDYFVVNGRDNAYYLTHNFEKKYSVAGWIFSDYHNQFDGMDKNTVIYGHNMVDQSMFGSIPSMFQSKWYSNDDNLKILLFTEKGNFLYQIFSFYTVGDEDYYIQTKFSSDQVYMEFLNTIQKRSLYYFGDILSADDRILTLSTCTPSGDGRMVIHARLVDS